MAKGSVFQPYEHKPGHAIYSISREELNFALLAEVFFLLPFCSFLFSPIFFSFLFSLFSFVPFCMSMAHELARTRARSSTLPCSPRFVV